MWFNLIWTDYQVRSSINKVCSDDNIINQLSWNESEYSGVDSVVVQPRNLWIPDILLYNRSVPSKVVSVKTIVHEDF